MNSESMKQNLDQDFGKGRSTVIGEHDDLYNRIEIQVEIFLPNRSSCDGCCGPAMHSSHLIVPMKNLEKGGFIYFDKVSNPNLPKKQKKRNKSKRIVRKSTKRGLRAAKLY